MGAARQCLKPLVYDIEDETPESIDTVGITDRVKPSLKFNKNMPPSSTASSSSLRQNPY